MSRSAATLEAADTRPAKWQIKVARFGSYKVSRPGRPSYFVFPKESRCTCQGWHSSEKAHPGSGNCVHLRAAVDFVLAVERAQREREAAARRKARGVSDWSFNFLFA